MKPRLLDLFCGAGGAAMGYHRVGFEVVGVDNKPQRHYPFTFVWADALEYAAVHGREFDAIHASPPCQRYSQATRLAGIYAKQHPDLIALTRQRLIALGKPYIIENVSGAPVENPLMLCGSMFGLEVYRHRFFESSVLLLAVTHAAHDDHMPAAGNGRSPKGYISIGPGGIRGVSAEERRRAMGIHWMNQKEMSQAIPPAYTEYIGRQLMALFA